jgi:hypothetical protein
MSYRDLVVELQAPAELDAAEADAFAYRCGVVRADVIDRILMRVVDDLGWSLFDEGVVDRVVVEHDGPTSARIVVDGVPATPWWRDRSWSADGLRRWTYEPETLDAR